MDILCLSETWLKPKHLSSTLLLPRFQPPVRRDRVVDRGGVVTIYLRDGLAFKNVPIVPTDIECIVVDVSLPRCKKLTVVTCYRPPGSAWMHLLTLWKTCSLLFAQAICVLLVTSTQSIRTGIPHSQLTRMVLLSSVSLMALI